jgi:hypothetical protein
MLDSRSHDLLMLARVALEAAIRTENDLLALLDEPPATSTPRGSAKPNGAPAAAEAHA